MARLGDVGKTVSALIKMPLGRRILRSNLFRVKRKCINDYYNYSNSRSSVSSYQLSSDPRYHHISPSRGRRAYVRPYARQRNGRGKKHQVRYINYFKRKPHQSKRYRQKNARKLRHIKGCRQNNTRRKVQRYRRQQKKHYRNRAPATKYSEFYLTSNLKPNHTICNYKMFQNTEDNFFGIVIQNRYAILSTIGEGTFGKVVKVNDIKVGGMRALKIIDNEHTDLEDALMEVKILQRIGEIDPNSVHLCVKMLDWFRHNGNICIVFDIFGQNMYEFLRENNFHSYPIQDIRHIVYQMCFAVKFLHDNNLTHTDLKPENIVFINSDYDLILDNASKVYFRRVKRTDIRLIDFGSAVFDNEEHNTTVTTRNYRAPEVILKLGWSHECDIWSIGCILFELYTGYTLFPVNNNRQHLVMMEKVLGCLPHSIARRSKSKYYAYGKLVWNKSNFSFRSIRESTLPLSDYFEANNEEHGQLFDLLTRLLVYSPTTRLSLAEALRHAFFNILPTYQRLGDFCACGDEK